MRRRRRRVTIGLLMLVVAFAAIVFKAVEYSRRVREVFVNRSQLPIQNLTISYAGTVEHLGTIAPNGERTHRFAFTPANQIRVAWDRQELAGKPPIHREAPAVTAANPGDVLRVETRH